MGNFPGFPKISRPNQQVILPLRQSPARARFSDPFIPRYFFGFDLPAAGI